MSSNQTSEVHTIQSLFHIQNKDGLKVPFILNDAQLLLDRMDNPTGRVRLIIAKARQKGFSRGLLAKFAIRCLGREGTRAVVISHESDATKRLLGSASYYFKHMNSSRPTFGFNSTKEMSFPLRDSTYYIGTAGSRAFGRGDTITDLHCSEYAYWADAAQLSTGLFQAVPYNGRIYIESTGNGRTNDFYRTWKSAERMGFTRLFYPWFFDMEYSLPVQSWKPDTTQHQGYLLEIQGRHKLTDQQMAWYQWKLRELKEDLKVMQQEYPSDPEECFQATGGAIFNNVNWLYNPLWEMINYQGLYVNKLKGHPSPGLNYSFGGDPSGGTGNDDAAIVGCCIETGEQVFELAYNTINPLRFAGLMCEIGKWFNTAFLTCESNNHGAAVIPYLKENYPTHRIYKRKYGTATTPPIYGWLNTDNNKHALVGLMQEELDQVRLYGRKTCEELENFEETPEGKMQGKSDNCVIAAGLSMIGLKRFSYLKDRYEEIFRRPMIEVVDKPNYMTYTLDEVLENIRKRRELMSGYFGDQSGHGYPN